MKKFINKNLLFIIGIIFVLFFFHKFFIFGLLPIPTDNIVGIYHPYRDFYSNEYPRGIPFQNMQVTDPVRQQYLWKELVISQIKQGEIPLWNPYNFSGYPLLANFQSAVFYPLNILMYIMPFEYGWSLLIISQPLLAFIFMFLFLQNLKISRIGSFIGSISFAFSGFFVSWLEWGNIVSTGLWLPLILLSIDKLIFQKSNKSFDKKNIWNVILLLSLVSSFFAGHLQTFFYMYIIAFLYFLLRMLDTKRKLYHLLFFGVINFLFLIITAVQWIPTLQLIQLSGRNVDQISTNVEGWFVPWQNLVQFLAPDFFGNPATLNYWGVWNYGEFIGYIGILPLVLAMGTIMFLRKKIVTFFIVILIGSIVLAYPSFIANLPFRLDVPFISTTQPTRLLFVIGFSLVVLSSLGFDYFRENKKKIIAPIIIVGIVFSALWIYVRFNNLLPIEFQELPENIAVSYSNLRLPTLIFIMIIVILVAEHFLPKLLKIKNLSVLIIGLLMVVFLFDIFRFADKYTVFSDKNYLYPNTKTLDYLENQTGQFRIMATDSRILPPNFSAGYGIQSLDGYDPLFLMRYAELSAAVGRNEPNINPPFGFNRIITPQNYQTNLINFLNVRYLLTLGDMENEIFEKVSEENETKIYENFIERVYFVEKTVGAENKYDAIDKLFTNRNELSYVAIVEDEKYDLFNKSWSPGRAGIVDYSPNKVIIRVENDKEGFLVFSDSYYPTWRVSIDGVESEIYRTNFNFRGIIVPANSSEIVFSNHLF